MISEEAYLKIYNIADHDSLDTLWWTTGKATMFDFPENYSVSYQNRINLFCLLLERMLTEGKLRLAKRSTFLEGTPKEQITLFKNALPKTAEEMNEQESYWWYKDECPGGAVWYTDVDDGFQTSPVGDGRFYYWM